MKLKSFLFGLTFGVRSHKKASIFLIAFQIIWNKPSIRYFSLIFDAVLLKLLVIIVILKPVRIFM